MYWLISSAINESDQMNVKASSIFEEFNGSGILYEMIGCDAEICRISPPEECSPGDMVFVNNAEYLSYVKKNRPTAVVLTRKLFEGFAERDEFTVFLAENVQLAHAILKKRFMSRDYFSDGQRSIHPSAVIHESVDLPASVRIAPGVVIEKNVRIGDRCVILAGTVIEEGVTIGEGTVIHPNVTIGHATEIGKECVIKSGSVIGSEGFGFAQDSTGRSYPIPQTGRVVLEERVTVGANCCIDRATYKETRIGSGTILDNLCHIAHNVTIGRDCILTAGFIVAGSTKIGDRVIASGQTGILDHLKIASDVVLLHRAGVTSDIPEKGYYAGLPLQPLDQYLKNSAIFQRLAEMRRALQKIKKT